MLRYHPVIAVVCVDVGEKVYLDVKVRPFKSESNREACHECDSTQYFDRAAAHSRLVSFSILETRNDV